MAREHNVLSLDAVLDDLGHCGRYQATTYLLVVFGVIVTSFHKTQYIFSVAAVDYRCEVPECESSPPEFNTDGWGLWALPESGGFCERLRPLDGACTANSFHMNETQKCSSWIYESNNSMVAEFNLACEDWKRTVVGTVHNVGVFVSLGIVAYISDTFGRKTAFIMTAVASGVFGLMRAYSTNYPMYLVLELIEASLGSGVYSTGYILALEMIGIQHRVLGGNILSSTFAIGQVILALIAWAIPYWRSFTKAIYMPAFLFLLYIFAIEESVRWLLTKGRKKEAARIIFKVATYNNRKLSPASIKMLTEEDEPKLTPQEEYEKGIEEPKPPSLYTQVINSKKLVSRVFICSFWWITTTFIYYGLSINSVSLAGNMYVNYILTSLVEIPGYFISFVTLDRFGRKSSIMTAFFICGISLTALPFIPIVWMVNTLAMVGKLAISMVFTSTYIYTMELFPTFARQSLMNSCSMIGRFGSMAAPQTPLLMEYMESLPYLIFGIMAAVSGLLMMLTPETIRIRLPDTIAQAENIAVAPRTARRTDVED